MESDEDSVIGDEEMDENMSEKRENKGENGGKSGDKTLKTIRKQVKNYHDRVTSLADSLEAPRPVWTAFYTTPNFLGWGSSITYRYDGDEMLPPVGLRDEVEFTRQELKLWSAIHTLEKLEKEAIEEVEEEEKSE